MWTAVKILGLFALCYAAVAVWVFFSQRKLLYMPRAELTATPKQIGLAYEDIRLTNRLGTWIHGWWLPADAPRFTLLFSHGNGGNLSHRLESLRIFHDLGLSVLIYDYSGYGQSQGEPGEEATRADARAAWDWLVREQGTDPRTIVLFGRSLGGAVTARLARELAETDTPPAGLILESTFTSVPDMGAYIYPWLPVRLLSRYQYDSATELAGLPLPALFLHSPDDDVVPYALGRRLHDNYLGPKTFLELQGDHNSGFLLTGRRYSDGLNRFLDGLGE
ncbi:MULTISPECIES: alpha/beta hydrolase [unclassified Pseudodesulfovibrio]|uniref:alpha/beta hydrolase n=1 Tax=unclassified Pseudodesulfovibrio TaxID=2661612 RepID=UPI001F4F25E8|nr:MULTISPECIES: alpha/beta hydrolase [unclassified Pseudodesulfovibrio]MCJ2165194.1 alpha/beta hydrolase [Pseudodesulfovibrio sp. S3-i]